jgi:hypothetical protein
MLVPIYTFCLMIFRDARWLVQSAKFPELVTHLDRKHKNKEWNIHVFWNMMHADCETVTIYKSTHLPIPEHLYPHQHCLRTSNLQTGIPTITVSSTKYCKIVRTAASSLGDPQFKYQPKDHLSCLKFMKISISLSRKIPERKSKLIWNWHSFHPAYQSVNHTQWQIPSHA